MLPKAPLATSSNIALHLCGVGRFEKRSLSSNGPRLQKANEPPLQMLRVISDEHLRPFRSSCVDRSPRASAPGVNGQGGSLMRSRLYRAEPLTALRGRRQRLRSLRPGIFPIQTTQTKAMTIAA